MNQFDSKVGGPLRAEGIDILQVNVGLVCNQACAHCHLECGPDRTEAMDWPTMERIAALADQLRPTMVDITGGAPELNPHLRALVRTLRRGGHRVQVRTNLTAMLEPGYTDYPEFFADHEVDLVASLPCYLEENVAAVRGDACFAGSIAMIRTLNALGYGESGPRTLDLVYNPGAGGGLPPDQAGLEADYRRELRARHGIGFSRLLTIANVPIGRSLDALRVAGTADGYMAMLADSFNPATVAGLMCRHQINIGWDGQLYDCDFNQALGLGVDRDAPGHVEALDDTGLDRLARRLIVTGGHCLACTAGAGSSCGGAIAGEGGGAR
jgi:radical SAM/Cys-rich protein